MSPSAGEPIAIVVFTVAAIALMASAARGERRGAVTLAAVLLYRLIAYWACIPLGRLAWVALRATTPTPDTARAAVEGDPA